MPLIHTIGMQWYILPELKKTNNTKVTKNCRSSRCPLGCWLTGVQGVCWALSTTQSLNWTSSTWHDPIASD